MFFFRVIAIVILFPALISCTTQKALNETGKEIDKGHYGVATWYVTTLPVVMLYDVFTLGGTSDPQTGYNTVVSVANKTTGDSVSPQFIRYAASIYNSNRCWRFSSDRHNASKRRPENGVFARAVIGFFVSQILSSG